MVNTLKMIQFPEVNAKSRGNKVEKDNHAEPSVLNIEVGLERELLNIEVGLERELAP